MQDILPLNSDTTATEIKDAIYCRISKAKAVFTCTIFASEFIRDDMKLDNRTLYNALWAADGYLEELETLFQHFKELH